MTFAPRSFRKMFSENLRDIASWRSLVIPFAVFFPIVINHPSNSIEVIWELITSPVAWVIYLLLFFFDALIRAAYWYARERNPSYIKKQEAYERLSGENELKKKSVESRESDES